MRNKLAIIFCLMCFIPIMGIEKSFAQATRTNSGDVTCPATGTSIEVVPARPGRFSIILNNISDTAVQIGYLDSGTAALTTSTAWKVQPGQATSDSTPGVNIKRIVCMSTSAVAKVITFNETYR